MNSKRYKDALYDAPMVWDLKEMLERSASLYAHKAIYLYKNNPSEAYKPILYKDFYEMTGALGQAFIDLGYKGKKIAVLGENRYEWVMTYMATVNGSSIIVPIDRELSASEAAGLMIRSGASALVYSEKSAKLALGAVDELVSAGSKIDTYSMDVDLPILLERGRKSIAQGKTDFRDVRIDREATCSIIFTSGTTGMAKGVMLSHKNIISNVIAMSEFVNVKGMTALSVLPMHHTYEFTCLIMTTMYQQCTVAFCDGFKYLTKNLAEAKVDVMIAVPLIFEKMYKRLMKTIRDSGKESTFSKALAVSKKTGAGKTFIAKKIFKDVHEALGGHVKLFIAGGAPIDPQIIEDLNAIGIPMIQGYGMTENSPIIAVNKDRYSKAAAAGLPLPGMIVEISNPDVDGIGEVIVKGSCVMNGYYMDPDATADSIVDGWLHTGDLGKFDEDGFLFLTGRKKNVIVTKNGKNIFPEEVEYYLLKSPFIEEAVVHGIDEDGYDTVVSAQIFPHYSAVRLALGISESEWDISDLSKHEGGIHKLIKSAVDDANGQAPSYKRIKRFTVRDTEFPKTTTQKIKRHEVI